MIDDLNRIASIVCRIGNLPKLRPDEDIYDAGFSSIASLELLMELESAYDVSIPDEEFVEARTIRVFGEIISRLK
jgi:acyl carrier protein